VVIAARSAHRSLMLAGLTGVLTGVAVALFDLVTADGLLATVRRQPVGVVLVAPAVGLVLTAACLRGLAGGASPSTSDEYVRNFHDRHQPLSLRPWPGRIAASLATLGFGGAMGFEGPSIYLGAGIGAFLQHRLSRLFTREDAKVLMTAGAAAGVAAIFKAPATGAIFALEVPYQQDLAARSAIPALVAAAASYLTFAAVLGTEPILAVRGNPGFGVTDLAGAALIGILAGGGARVFSRLVATAKSLPARLGPTWSLALGAAGVTGTALLAQAAFDSPLTVGPGYNAITYAADFRHPLGLVALLFALRALACASTVAGGGAGGTFIPLVVQGALLGRLVGSVIPADETLFSLVGASAFLGAGYRTPIAAVMFVAESTGKAGFVVPGLVATAIAQLLMGRTSITPYQQARQAGHVERRFLLPVSAALLEGVHTVTPTTTVTELVQEHFPTARAKSIPVVDDDGRYLGMVRLDDVACIPRDEREELAVGDLLRTDLPALRPGWTLRQAVAAMETADVERLAVTQDGRFLGVVTATEIVRLDQILEETED
jgi:CIC family chloride channel protein